MVQSYQAVASSASETAKVWTQGYYKTLYENKTPFQITGIH